MPIRDWAPRDHTGVTVEEHMSRLATWKSKDQTKWNSYYLNPVITLMSAGFIIMFVIFAAVWQDDFGKETQRSQRWVTDVWNWIYMISQNIWIIVLFYVLFKYYNIRLGKDNEEPEFSDATYFTMIFSAGVATGLFYFTAEPMWHYTSSSARWAYMDDDERADHALMITYFHWGVHGWVPYVVVGAVVAILTYRRGFPMSMRFCLYPLIGEMSYGLLGDIIEVLSILCTIFGVCTSLGLGAGQILAGLKRLDQGFWRGEYTGCTVDWMDPSPRVTKAVIDSGLTHNNCGTVGLIDTKREGQWNSFLIIIAITGMATCSVVAGLKAGIAFLSQLAFVISLFILLSILFLDDTWYILNAFSSSFGYYLWYMIRISFHTDAWQLLGSKAEQEGGSTGGGGFSQVDPSIMHMGNCTPCTDEDTCNPVVTCPAMSTDHTGVAAGATGVNPWSGLKHFSGSDTWMNGWTIFYWGWWISWGPFVGTFLARISRGRKLGQFIVLSLVLPTLWSCVFMGIFGAAQIRIENQARSAGLPSDTPYGHLHHLNGNVGEGQMGTWTVYTDGDQRKGQPYWKPVDPATTKLSALATNNIIFDHMAYYGGAGWSQFFTVVTLICIVLYFVTSSDSASFVVDMLAANGNDDPPLWQRISWASLEGVCAGMLVITADPDKPGEALGALQSVPIILGLPFTFLLFWMCHALMVLCREESKEIPLVRKNFKIFHLNMEPAAFISFVAPFLPLGDIAFQCWGGSRAKWQMRFAMPWLLFITFVILGVADWAFAVNGTTILPIFGLLVGGVRVGVRNKLGIDGDVISDVLVGTFLMPFCIGQMAAEDLQGDDSQSKHNLVAPVGESKKDADTATPQKPEADEAAA
jgi:choline-glycine betaine transporter